MKCPNYQNLLRRAKDLGLTITRTTSAEDKRAFGDHFYVLHHPVDDDPMYMNDMTLWGIESLILDLEAKQEDCPCIA